jgi:hypothetical protein
MATISSAGENSFLYNYIISKGYKSAYFGYSDAAVEGKWKWCTSENITYTNWHSGEPNAENSDEDYAMFYWKYSDGTWNDGDFGGNTNNGGSAFICEWDYLLTLSDSKIQMNCGENTYITYTLTSVNNQIISASASWKSSNTAVAKVSQKGKVVAVGAGTCKITCTVKGISKTVTIIVNPKKVTSIKTLSKTKTSVQLKWKAQSGIKKYEVYMYDTDLEEYVKVKTLSGKTNSVRIAKLKKGKKYKFKIRAYVTYGTKKYYGTFSSVYTVKTRK